MKTPACLLLMCLTAAISVPLSKADVDVSVSAEIHLGNRPPPAPAPVVAVEASGPPPWAPAHGFRRNRDFYYYPGHDVYYSVSRQQWIYLSGDRWIVAAALPDLIHIDFSRAVKLTMETDEPYQYHREVVNRYPRDYYARSVGKTEARGKQSAPVAHGKESRGDSQGDTAKGQSSKGKGHGKHGS